MFHGRIALRHTTEGVLFDGSLCTRRLQDRLWGTRQQRLAPCSCAPAELARRMALRSPWAGEPRERERSITGLRAHGLPRRDGRSPVGDVAMCVVCVSRPASRRGGGRNAGITRSAKSRKLCMSSRVP